VLQELVFDQKERVGAWVAEHVDQSASWGSFYAMGVEQDGEIVAGVVVNNFNGSNATCHIAVTKPGKAMIKLFEAVTDYAFRQCRLNRLTGMVPASKPDVLAFDLHLGWEHEFTMPKGAPDGDDLHVLVMWPDTCRWWKTRGVTA
jgi:hypothetical protein